MKILFYVNSKQNFRKSNYLGGIEVLNYDLHKFIKRKHYAILTNSITNNIRKTNWDIIISSNDAKVFNLIKSKRKILWLHNKLQIEKAFRKKQLFPILFNKIEAVFVSKFLNNITSKLYFFKKRIIIPNFLPHIFNGQNDLSNTDFKRKKIVWSVQREKGLKKIIEIWIKKINKLQPDSELHIFTTSKLNIDNLKKFNVYFHGKISRKRLLNFYKQSFGMICLGYDETFCLNAIEAMKMGLPVISLGETALNELIVNNKNGLKVNNLMNIDRSILKLLSLNRVERSKIGQTASSFTKKFDSRNIFKKWTKLISN